LRCNCQILQADFPQACLNKLLPGRQTRVKLSFFSDFTAAQPQLRDTRTEPPVKLHQPLKSKDHESKVQDRYSERRMEEKKVQRLLDILSKKLASSRDSARPSSDQAA
jgi:hypothetical protein